MHEVLRYATQRNMKIILITNRPISKSQTTAVVLNFKYYGLNQPDLMCFNPAYPHHGNFKATLRHQISAQGMKISLIIGDQWWDVNEPNGAAWIKLPGRRDLELASSVGIGAEAHGDWGGKRVLKPRERQRLSHQW